MFSFCVISGMVLQIVLAFYILVASVSFSPSFTRIQRLFLFTNGIIFVLQIFGFHCGQELILMNGLIYIDQLSLLLSGMITIFTMLTMLIYSVTENNDENHIRFIKFVSLFQITIAVILVAQHLSVILMALVGATLCLYPLIMNQTPDPSTNEAAVKYMLQSGLAMAVSFVGLSFLYGTTGSLFMNEMRIEILHHTTPQLIVLGGLLFLIGLMFKTGKAPLHFWMVDVFYTSSYGVILLSGLIMKLAVISIFLSFTRTLMWDGPQMISVFIKIIAYISLIWGSIAAYRQVNLMRFLAYSSIAQMALVYLGALEPNDAGMYSALMYFFVYAISFFGIFLVLANIKDKYPEIEVLHDLAGLHSIVPGQALALSIFLLSLAGLPPLGGFFTKLYVLQGLLRSSDYISVTFVLIASVLGVFFYLNFIKIIYFDSFYRNVSKAEISLKTRTLFNLLILVFIGFLALYPFVGGYLQDQVHAALSPYKA